MKIKVREFIKFEEEFDVYDDVCEALAICFCGPLALTEDGEKHFAEILDYDIELDLSGSIFTAAVCVNDDDDKTWKRRLKKAREFFYSAAGYCKDSDWGRWFVDNNHTVENSSLLI